MKPPHPGPGAELDSSAGFADCGAKAEIEIGGGKQGLEREVHPPSPVMPRHGRIVYPFVSGVSGVREP